MSRKKILKGGTNIISPEKIWKGGNNSICPEKSLTFVN
jgi:hypothetical protein